MTDPHSDAAYLRELVELMQKADWARPGSELLTRLGAIADRLTPRPVETAPRDRWILLSGPSGYRDAPMRCVAARWSPDVNFGSWRDHAGDAVTDDGPPPTHWTELPT